MPHERNPSKQPGAGKGLPRSSGWNRLLAGRRIEETAMIDMHAHWRPAELAEALRARTREPRIVRNDDGVEVLKTRVGEEPLANAFDDADTYLARMDRLGVSTSVLSLLGSACW